MGNLRHRRSTKACSLLWAAAGVLGALSPVAAGQALAADSPAPTAAPAAAASPPTSDAERIKQLERWVNERDILIHDLEVRVERLEHAQIAQIPGAPAQAGPPPQAAPPAPTQQAQNTPPPPGVPGAQPPAPSGPGSFTVSEEDAKRALERALVQTGAALLPRWKFELVPSALYQYQEVSTPGQLALTTSGQVLITENVLRETQAQGGLLLRAGLPWDMQLEVGAPYDYRSNTVVSRVGGSGLSETGPGVHGFGDPSITLTKQLMVEGDLRPGLFATVGWNANLGQVKDNVPLGKGFNQLLAGFTAVKRQDPLVFTGGFSYIRSGQNNGVRPGDEYVGSAGLLFAVSPQTSLQFSQQLIFYGKDSFGTTAIPGSERVAGIFNVGLLSVLGRNRVITFSVGIGETPAAPNFIIQMTMPIRLN